jgi:hypothetical protein
MIQSTEELISTLIYCERTSEYLIKFAGWQPKFKAIKKYKTGKSKNIQKQ